MKIKNLMTTLFAISGVIFLVSFMNPAPLISNPGSKLNTEEDSTERDKTTGCGGIERWDVKVFTDPLAYTINWTPKSTSVAHLVAISTPTPSASMPRYQQVEDSTYIFSCLITIKKDEADSDFHLILSDGTHTLVGEVPDPTCSSVAASPKIAQFIAARNWVIQNIGYGNKNVNLPPVTVTGVAFIDPPHGQTGAAPNNIEIHSIIDLHFTPTGTPPVVTTQAATNVTTTAASLNGSINPNNLETTYHFEWGLTTSYGNSTTATSAGSGSSVINVSGGISGLMSGTTYHYRLVATNSAGTTYGTDLSLTTLSPTLSVTPSNQPVTSVPGSTSFNVTSNSGWTAVSNQSWCTVTASGSGNGMVTANYLVNSTVNQRVANITTTVSGLSPVVVTVTQAGATPTRPVTPSDQPAAATAGNTAFNVTSNTNWTAVSYQSWCTVTPSGSGNGTITAASQQNTSVLTRIATITVTVTGLLPIPVTVTQAAAPPVLSVTPSNQSVTYNPGATAFTVTSNTTWTVSSDQSWCTPTLSGSGNGLITAGYLQNSTFTSRVAHLTATVTGLTPAIVTVTQAGVPLPPEPTNFPTNFSGCNILVQWTDATGGVLPTNYLIRMSSTGFSSIVAPVDGTPVPESQTDKNVAAGVQEAWFTNLVPNTTYYFKIYGYTGSGSTIYYKTDGQVPDVQETTLSCGH